MFAFWLNKLQAGGRHDIPPHRPASGDIIRHVRIWIGHHYCMSMLACQYNQPKRPGDLDLWPWKWCPSHVWCAWATSVSILVLASLFSSYARCTRQTDRQTKASLNAPAYQGRGRIVADAVLVQLLGTGRLVLVIEPQVDYWYIVRVLEPKYSLARGLFVSTVFRGINA